MYIGVHRFPQQLCEMGVVCWCHIQHRKQLRHRDIVLFVKVVLLASDRIGIQVQTA